MTFDLKRIIESKRKLRRDLASRPVGEKLAILDALRERAVTIGRTRESAAVHEAQAEYGTSPGKPTEPASSGG